jgi:Ca2+:H+ antiporter
VPPIATITSSIGVIACLPSRIVNSLSPLPETLASVRNAQRGRLQISLNLAFGSAMASIGLTIPTIAVASIWLPGRLVRGLNATQIVLLVLTVAVGALAAPLGRAALLQSGVRLVIFAAFLFLAVRP